MYIVHGDHEKKLPDSDRVIWFVEWKCDPGARTFKTLFRDRRRYSPIQQNDLLLFIAVIKDVTTNHIQYKRTFTCTPCHIALHLQTN